jgi:hypothetical protein
MRKSFGFAILLGLALCRSAWAQQPVYDEDDEDALAAQQAAQASQAQQYGYVGPHPIPYDMGSGFCYEQGAHFHEYPPFDQYLFRENGGWFYFVGDPGDFGYSQETWGYNGNHPIPLAYGGGYCFITWPHRHFYSPAASMTFNFVGGYYVYAGPWDPWYWTWRDRYVGYWGGYYRNSYFGGRYYVVRPPPVYRPSLYVGAPGVYRPGVVVNAPPGRVGAPAARITVPPPRAGYVGAPPARGAVAAPGARGGYTGAPPARGAVGAPPPARGSYTGAPPPAYHPYSSPAPAQHYQAPAQHYQAPAPHYSAPPPPRPAPASRPAPAPAGRHR